MTAAESREKRGGARSAARLAAVQALFQIEQDTENTPGAVVTQFRAHRLGKEVDGSLYAAADAEFFEDVVLGASGRGEEIDGHVSSALSAGWRIERLDSVLRAILRAGCYELLARPDVPTPSVIDEYVDIAHAFFEGSEPGFVNGVLDALARKLRSRE